eukprot:TRINITY_DN39586_c0_g1_i1.p1 TRINITY_DN39586_c0_g1~~TRINITY_DN39586_c0_g1_i1.p1  ORF type:complete len:178 (-),score=21.16 TRINITY_DN39586_c0_g1_i1:230-763(-)
MGELPGERAIKSFAQGAGASVFREETFTISGFAGSVSMIVLASLSLADFEFAQSAMCLFVGLLCLQGEWSAKSDSMSSYQTVVHDYFGFALSSLGRGIAYGISALHCLAVGAAGHSSTFGALWYVSALLCFMASVMSLFSWRGYHKQDPQQNFVSTQETSFVEGSAGNVCKPYEPPC